MFVRFWRESTAQPISLQFYLTFSVITEKMMNIEVLKLPIFALNCTLPEQIARVYSTWDV